MPIHRFTDLEAWQRARELHAALCDACDHAPLQKRYRLVQQLKAASSSAMANIAEGFERWSPDEFHKSLCIAKGESGEIYSHLVAAKDDGLLTDEQFGHLSSLATRLGQLVGALRRSIEPRCKKRKR
jgi:four helix bundle protein